MKLDFDRFRKDKGTRGQIANICWIIEKAREFQKNIYFCTAPNSVTVWITANWKILKEVGIPDHLTYLLRNARLVEAQAGTKIARRNINNLRYSDDTTLMVESEKELKSLS